MRSNRKITVGIALIAGAVVLLFLYLFSANRSAEGPKTANNTATPVQPVSYTGNRVAVAAVNIPPHTLVVPAMLRMKELGSGESVTDDYFTSVNDTNGFITRQPITMGIRLRKSFMAGHITEVGIAAALRPDMRAIAIPIPTRPTFHDVVRIGDTIDIVASFDGQESRTIVPGVRVLGVDVFGNDYPTTSIAQRGDYKSPGRSPGAAPPSPPSPPQNVGQAPPPPTPPPPAGQEPVAPGQPTPVPQATPTPTPPPARPAPAIIVEVTPEQANRISLAQNSNAVLDFLIVPPTIFVVPGGAEGQVAAVTRVRLAPYAESKKATGTRTAAAPRGSGGGGDRSLPILPQPAPGPISPMSPGTLSSPTYDIPIYVDGKQVRVDTVRKPRSGS